MSRTLWLWGRGGYYRLDVDESGMPSIPAGEKPWRAFIAHAPPAMVKDAHEGLKAWFGALEAQADKVGPEAAVRFGKEARQWLIEQKRREKQDGR